MRPQNLRTITLGITGALFLIGTVLYIWSPQAVASRERERRIAAARAGDLPTEDPTGDVSSAGASRETPGLEDATARPLWIESVARGGSSSVARVSGFLVPARRVVLAAQTNGSVVERLARQHTHVTAGEVLLKLDSTAHRAAVKRLEAGLVRARAAKRLAEHELERLETLSSSKIASDSQLQVAISEERAAYAGVAEAEALLEEARDLLAKTDIRAPFDGTVNWLDLEPGAFVRVGDRAAEVVDLASVEMHVSVTEHEVIALSPGDPVEIRVDVYPALPFEGRIQEVGRSGDASGHKYPVRVSLENPDERLLPGMVAEVAFQLTSSPNAIQIPRRAVFRQYELDYVFVVEQEGNQAIARRRRVALRPVPFQPERVEIVDGLEPGERIAISSVRQLEDGMPVRARTPKDFGS